MKKKSTKKSNKKNDLKNNIAVAIGATAITFYALRALYYLKTRTPKQIFNGE